MYTYSLTLYFVGYPFLQNFIITIQCQSRLLYHIIYYAYPDLPLEYYDLK